MFSCSYMASMRLWNSLLEFAKSSDLSILGNTTNIGGPMSSNDKWKCVSKSGCAFSVEYSWSAFDLVVHFEKNNTLSEGTVCVCVCVCVC
jgi:hypothetical protein